MTVLRTRLSLRRSETIVLCLVALLFTVATGFDVARQVSISARFRADRVSWTSITGRHSHRIYVVQISPRSSRDVVCGPVPPFHPRERIFACLILSGPVRAGHRTVLGGYHFLATYRFHHWELLDHPRTRYGCFGDATAIGKKCRGRAP